jgi:hypothetical protein
MSDPKPAPTQTSPYNDTPRLMQEAKDEQAKEKAENEEERQNFFVWLLTGDKSK